MRHALLHARITWTFGEHGRSNVVFILVDNNAHECFHYFHHEGKPQHQQRRATGPSHPSRRLTLVRSSQGWMMCDPVREHRFRSCHTIYSVHLSMGDILDHPTLRRRVRALRRLRRTLTLRQLGAGEHPCDHQTISKSPSHRLHWAMPLSGNFAIQATSLLQSSLNSLSYIFFSAPFFQRGLRHLISRGDRRRLLAFKVWTEL